MKISGFPIIPVKSELNRRTRTRTRSGRGK